METVNCINRVKDIEPFRTLLVHMISSEHNILSVQEIHLVLGAYCTRDEAQTLRLEMLFDSKNNNKDTLFKMCIIKSFSMLWLSDVVRNTFQQYFDFIGEHEYYLGVMNATK